MATSTRRPPAVFDPAAHSCFRFSQARLDPSGALTLGYALEGPAGRIDFSERIEVPVPALLSGDRLGQVRGLVSLLHWAAGVSYYKAALPAQVAFDAQPPGPAAAAWLQALYSEGLGELAFRNGLPGLPRPIFAPAGPAADGASSPEPRAPRSAR